MSFGSNNTEFDSEPKLGPPKTRDLRQSNRLKIAAFGFAALFFFLFGVASLLGILDPRLAAVVACGAGALIAFADALYIRQMDHSIALMASALEDSSRDVNDVSSEFVLPESSPVKKISQVIAQRDGRVRELVFRVRHGIRGVSLHAARLANALEDTSRLSNVQRGLAEKVFAASETSREAVAIAREQANDLDKVTSRQRQAAETSYTDLRSALNRSQDTEERLQSFYEAVEQLEKHSNEIGEVIAVISAISDQTNLLALNASIEASSAGAAGKGFAVVATEVRQLAEQVKRATDGISASIDRMNSMVAETREQTADIQHHVDATAKSVKQASERFESMVQEYMTMGERIAATSNAIVRLSDSNHTVHDLAKEIHQSCDDVSSRMQEGEQHLMNLSDATERIQDISATFQVGSDKLESIPPRLRFYRRKLEAILQQNIRPPEDIFHEANSSSQVRVARSTLAKFNRELKNDLRALSYVIITNTRTQQSEILGDVPANDLIANRANANKLDLLQQTYTLGNTILFDYSVPLKYEQEVWGVLRIGFKSDAFEDRNDAHKEQDLVESGPEPTEQITEFAS